jgi:hypothetical protein
VTGGSDDGAARAPSLSGRLAGAEGRSVTGGGALSGAEKRTGALTDAGVSSQPPSMSSNAPAAFSVVNREPLFALEAISFTSSCHCRAACPYRMSISGGAGLIF